MLHMPDHLPTENSPGPKGSTYAALPQVQPYRSFRKLLGACAVALLLSFLRTAGWASVVAGSRREAFLEAA